MTITLIPLCVGWDSIESRLYSDQSPGGYSNESPGGYSTKSTVDSMESRVDSIESPLHCT